MKISAIFNWNLMWATFAYKEDRVSFKSFMVSHICVQISRYS